MKKFEALSAGWHLPCVVLIMVISAWLRLRGLTTQSYWNDELATIVLSYPGNSFLQVLFHSLNDRSPALYQVLLWLWFDYFGFTELGGRLFSALAGILALPALYFMSREFAGRNAALFATLAGGLSHYHIFYSQEVRSYALFFLLATLSFLFLARLIRTGNFGDLAFYTISTVALVNTHYYGLLLYVALFSLMLLFVTSNRYGAPLPPSYLLTNQFFTLLCLLPAVPFIIINALDKSFWIKTPSPDFLFDYFSRYFVNDYLILAYVLLLLAGIYVCLSNRTLQTRIALLLFILVLFFIYLAPYFRSLVSTPMLVHRYTIGALPLVFLFIAYGYRLLPGRRLKLLTTAIVIALNVYVLFIEKDYYNAPTKQQYRDVIKVVAPASSDIPVYACKDDRVDRYFDMLGHPADVRDEDNIYLQLAGNRISERFWYIGTECCDCRDNLENLENYISNSTFLVEREVYAKSAFAILLSVPKDTDLRQGENEPTQ